MFANGTLSLSKSFFLADESCKYKYHVVPVAEHLFPYFGTFNEGAALTIYGQNFENSVLLTCVFQLPHVTSLYHQPAKWISLRRVICNAPSVPFRSEAQVAQVFVTNNPYDANGNLIVANPNSQTSFSNPLTFLYHGNQTVSVLRDTTSQRNAA